MDPILLSPGPKFAQDKRVAGQPEMQQIVNWAREVQTAFNTVQKGLSDEQVRLTKIESRLVTLENSPVASSAQTVINTAKISLPQFFADDYDRGDGDDNLLARAIAATGNVGELVLAGRTYNITKKWSIGPNETNYAQISALRISGQNPGAVNGTQILQTSINDPCIEATDTMLEVRGILFRNRTSVNTADAIRLVDCAHGAIRRCAFMAFGSSAIRFSGSACHTWVIDTNFSQNCKWGVTTDTGTELLSSSIGPRNEFTSTESSGSRTCVGVELRKAVNVIIRENTLETLKYGVRLNTTSTSEPLGVVVEKNYFESLDSYAIFLSGTGQFTTLRIQDNFGNLTGAVAGIFCEACQFFGLQIHSNVVSPDAGLSIDLRNATNFRWGSSITLTGGDFTTTDLFLPTSGVDLPEIHIGSIVGSSRKATVSADMTVNATDARNVYLLTPTTAVNVNPSAGGWIQGQAIVLVNLASANNLTFDSTGIARTVLPGETAVFRWEGTVWGLKKDASILGAASIAFRGATAFSVVAPATFGGTLTATGTVFGASAFRLAADGSIANWSFGTVNGVASVVMRAGASRNFCFQNISGTTFGTFDASGFWSIGASLPTSKFGVEGSFATKIASTAVGLTLGVLDHTIVVTATGQTVTLPTAIGISGREYVVKLTVAGTIIIATTGGQTIDGAATYTVPAQWAAVKVQSDGANWVTVP